ncbi:hypothetical protein [Rhizohabitans arisaemae]|uniref:hypothetical protein n=1 Tax=Rhizohabitans arisaemae TaxID=2720610 RepID=UPI0024B0C789|nr:hypothetical protein [Rhizohabitans arisaemae]
MRRRDFLTLSATALLVPTPTEIETARGIFGGVVAGDPGPLTELQTSHHMDLAIGGLAARDKASVRYLTRWMGEGSSALLRVNSAGIIAKLPMQDHADDVISALRRDPDTRHLYITAVAARVLTLDRQDAGAVVISIGKRGLGLSAEEAETAVQRFAKEIHNPRDVAARWCSAVMLGELQQTSGSSVKETLSQALRLEPCRENLRTIGTILAGQAPY